MPAIVDAVWRRVAAVQERVAGLLRGARRRSRVFDHLGRGFDRYRQQRGDRLAAALSFYGFLSFFPLTALAFAAVGYAVTVSPHAADLVSKAISDLLPGLAAQLPVQRIAAAKTGAGVLGLAGLLWAGLGWIGVWRESLRTMWMLDPDSGNFFLKKLGDLVVLLTLAVVLLASAAASGLATSMTHLTLAWLHLQAVPGAGSTLQLASVGVALAADLLIFLLLLWRLSGSRASWRPLVKGALFGAVGLEVLKLAGALLIKHTTRNPVYASFAVMVGLLVWINLACRLTLFTAAWTATRHLILATDTATDTAPEGTPHL